MKVYSEIELLIESLQNEFHVISDIRKIELKNLASTIVDSINQFGRANLISVCTHNSRRSQLAQIWLKTAVLHYNVRSVQTYSGGTEATAFNRRMVDAIVRAGFRVNQIDVGANPKYYLPISDEDYSLDILYSKRYDESYNPQRDFVAIMVCSQADEACPLVEGAYKRISLPYQDPKDFDDTKDEKLAYDNKVREIGREMLYMGSLLKDLSNPSGANSLAH